jgi:methylglyoxal synthase
MQEATALIRATTASPRIALVAQDSKRDQLVELLKEMLPQLRHCRLVATQVTGMVCRRALGVDVQLLASSVKGGDLQIGALVADGKLDAVIYLGDPLIAAPYAPDIAPILRVCDLYNVPIATNIASARAILSQFATYSFHKSCTHPTTDTSPWAEYLDNELHPGWD